MGSPEVALGIDKSPDNTEDSRETGSILGLGRFPGVGNGKLLQYSCLENFMDRVAWKTIVYGVTKC